MKESEKETAVKLPAKRPTRNNSTSWNGGGGMKDWLTK